MDLETRIALNRLAREQRKAQLLADIKFDLMVCLMEGWDAKEYINELHSLIDDVAKCFNQK